jgi:Rps23 Pro-64 3,4-dihydroxylase Tpa1-like proline 4-hydroxylase
MEKDLLKPIEVILNAVPEEHALLARQEFLDADYDKISQERKGFYSRGFDDHPPCMPSTDEVYYSEFYRSNFLENNTIIRECFYSYIKPLIEEKTNKKIVGVDLRCYKMTEGCHFRVHKDTYKADVGFIWYLSKEWKWDWGGLLLTVKPDQTAEVTIPKFNQLVIMDHKYNQVPHSVTQVTSFAKEPRIILVGFLQSDSVYN